MAARRGRGSTAVRVIFSQHAEILQYSRKTITGRFYATDRLDVLYRSGARDLEFTGVCIMVFYYTGQIVTFQLLEWIIILVDLILGFIDGLLLGSARLLLPECLTRD